MTLAYMYAEDSDALECDLAETYGLFDLHAVPLHKLALLACGLRDDSRIKLKLAGLDISVNTLMLGHAVDCLAWLCWAKTKDGAKGRNRPKSIVEALLHHQEEVTQHGATQFDSAEAFEVERNRILAIIKEGESDA